MKAVEKETIILFNEAEEIATIDTYNAKLKRKIRSYAEEHPELCKVVEDDETRVKAEIAKDRLSVNLKNPVSPERLEAMRERGKELMKNLHNS